MAHTMVKYMYGRDKRTYSQLFKLLYMEIEQCLFPYGKLQLGHASHHRQSPICGKVLRMKSFPFNQKPSVSWLFGLDSVLRTGNDIW